MKILRVGDPHVTVANLKDSHNLIQFIGKTALENKVDRIEFLGDQFHTHSVIRAEVQHFWKESVNFLHKTLKGKVGIALLVGNHDVVPTKEKERVINAVSMLANVNKSVIIIDKPMIMDNIGYIPYTSDKEMFLKESKDLFDKGATKMLVAHQTFTGAKYENGFYAEDGIEPSLISQESIVSGHIHTSQQIGKCFYTGTPKWDTMADANQEKGIWIFEHNEDGSIVNKTIIPTRNIVTPIVKYIVNEGEALPILKENERNYVELYGKSSWILEMKKKLKGMASVKAIPSDKKMNAVHKDKLLSLQDYLNNYFTPSANVDKLEIDTYLRGL